MPGHPSSPEQSGCCPGPEQRGAEEIAAGCAGRGQVKWGQGSLSLGMAGWAIPGVGNQEVPHLLCQSCAVLCMAVASLLLIFVFFLR